MVVPENGGGCQGRSIRIAPLTRSRTGGAPVAAIQALAGHADLSTTQRYMHLSPAALEGAIGLLERGIPDPAGER